MRDSLAFRGSALWNLLNFNDKIDNLNLKKKKRIFHYKGLIIKKLIFDITTASTSRYRESNYLYF